MKFMAAGAEQINVGVSHMDGHFAKGLHCIHMIYRIRMFPNDLSQCFHILHSACFVIDKNCAD